VEEMDTWIIRGLGVFLNVTYFLILVTVISKMALKTLKMRGEPVQIARWFKWSLLLLAIGEGGHALEKTLAFVLQNNRLTFIWLGEIVALEGAMAFLSAVSITLFYMFMIEVWRLRFNTHYNQLYRGLQGFLVLRFVLLLMPQNQWRFFEMNYSWSIIRNIPLVIVGLLLASLIYTNAKQEHDDFFAKVGQYMFIFLSDHYTHDLLLRRCSSFGHLKNSQISGVCVDGKRSL
jgi:hypothetical protein